MAKNPYEARSHEGGVPFDLFGILPAAVRSGLHMKKEKTIQLIDQLNRELVEMIPEPPIAPVSLFLIAIQVASFLDKGRADKTLDRLEQMGLKPRIVSVTLSERLWHRIILGPYFQRSAAERGRDMIKKQTSFKPIFVRHTPEVKEDKTSKE